MVGRILLIALFSLFVGLLPAASLAQSTITVVDGEPVDGPGDMVFAMQHNAVYVTSLAFDSGHAITHRVEPNQTLTPVGRTPVGSEPRAIAMARNGDYAVLVNSNVNQIAVMSIGDDGLLREVGRYPSGGLNPYDVAVGFNDIVVVTNRDSDQLTSFHIDRRGRLTPLDVAIPGVDPHVVSVSSRGFVAVANQTDRTISIYRMNRRGELRDGGTVMLDNMTPRTLTWRGSDLFVALDGPAPAQDMIRRLRVRRGGQVEYLSDTPAGAFLTDLEANEDGLFAVTVNTNGPGGADDANEVRSYRFEGNQLVQDAAVQTAGAPSFKQITARRLRNRAWQIVTSEYQGGWIRSFIYRRDDE